MKSYGMFGAWIAWKSPNEMLRIGLWGRNLAGKKVLFGSSLCGK